MEKRDWQKLFDYTFEKARTSDLAWGCFVNGIAIGVMSERSNQSNQRKRRIR